jgi:glyoxylase-like metal-dependent hydrolase (beta-lactamase superfamily II)
MPTGPTPRSSGASRPGTPHARRLGTTLVRPGPHAATPGPPGSGRRRSRTGDADVLDLGSVQAVALAVPGRTPGSVAFYLPDPRVLFTGDTIARSPDGRVGLGVFNADPARRLLPPSPARPGSRPRSPASATANP